MPTYEYECTKCNQQFEYFQSINEAPKQECEACGGSLVKLLSAGTGLIFKGSGFYITDYKNGSAGKSETTESKPAAAEKPAPASTASADKK